MGNGFQCYFRELLNTYLAIRICKNYCRILKIILVPDFCPLKLKIARFPIGFGLNLFRPAINIFELIRRVKQKLCFFLSEMDILAVAHYPEMNIQTFFELKSAFLSLFVA